MIDRSCHLGDALSALADDELSPDELAAARAHLDACSACRAELDAVRAVRAAVRGLAPVEPPAALTATHVRATAPAPRRRRVLVDLGAAAAVWLAVVAIGGGRLGAFSVSPEVDRLVQSHSATALAGGGVAEAGAPSANVPARWPEQLPGRYRPVAARRQGATLHVVYGNGDTLLSVFQQPGRLDESRLPPGGQRVRIAGGEGWRWVAGAGEFEIVVFERRRHVYTVVAPAPGAVADRAAEAVPDPGPPSVVERLRSTGRALFGALGVG